MVRVQVFVLGSQFRADSWCGSPKIASDSVIQVKIYKVGIEHLFYNNLRQL